MYRHTVGTQLYYIIKLIYNVSTTCFDHYLAIIRLYFTYKVTVLYNQCIQRETRSRLQWLDTWARLIGWYQHYLFPRTIQYNLKIHRPILKDSARRLQRTIAITGRQQDADFLHKLRVSVNCSVAVMRP